MRELSKSIHRRLNDSRFARRYFRGHGVDIGGEPDPLAIYEEFFPLMESCRTWDLSDGDAQFMDGVPDDSFDFVHSSHCLEHVHDPFEALRNWLRITRPEGYVVVTLPDEDLYEQGVWPAAFNRDHKKTFTLFKHRSWSPDSVNIFDLLTSLGEAADIEKVEQVNSAYRYRLPRVDQTYSPVAESAIEFIIRKRPEAEIAFGGHPSRDAQPDRLLRVHMNQYMDDHQTLKEGNAVKGAPFRNDQDL